MPHLLPHRSTHRLCVVGLSRSAMSAVAPSGEAELRRLVEEVNRRSPPSYSLTTELLAFLTAQHFHEPQLTLKYGKALILHHRGTLGDKGHTLITSAGGHSPPASEGTERRSWRCGGVDTEVELSVCAVCSVGYV